MREWWEKLTPTQRRLVLIGVPVVAVAALWSTLHRPPSSDAADTNAGDAGDGTAPPTAAAGPAGYVTTGDPSAVGSVGTLSAFLSRVGEVVQASDEQSAAAREQLAADIEALRADQQATYDQLAAQLDTLDRDQSMPSPTPAPDRGPTAGTGGGGAFDPGQVTLINTDTGRAAFTGPSGEGGFAKRPPADQYPGAVSWRQPDGRISWYIPGQFIDPGNVGALARYSGAGT